MQHRKIGGDEGELLLAVVQSVVVHSRQSDPWRGGQSRTMIMIMIVTVTVTVTGTKSMGTIAKQKHVSKS